MQLPSHNFDFLSRTFDFLSYNYTFYLIFITHPEFLFNQGFFRVIFFFTGGNKSPYFPVYQPCREFDFKRTFSSSENTSFMDSAEQLNTLLYMDGPKRQTAVK